LAMDLGVLLRIVCDQAAEVLQASSPTERRAGSTEFKQKEQEQMSMLKTATTAVF